MDKSPADTVLVVEDHDSVRIAIARFLKAGGFNVLEAANPEDATTIWDRHANRLSLLVVDIDLMSMTGPELVQLLFKQGRKVPVIFTTAAESSLVLDAVRDFPDPAILYKPFSADVLIKAVRTALSDPVALSGLTRFIKRSAESQPKARRSKQLRGAKPGRM